MSTTYENISYGVRSMSSAMNSRPSSPHSAPALPSPPTSPNLHSVSVPGSPSSLGSFPSALSGSIWSLEDGGYVRRAAADEVEAFSSHEHPESAHHLVIPSLALGPSIVAAPAPAPEMENAYGEALGNVRLLVLGGQRSLADNLLMRSPHVVHIHGWDQPTGDVLASLEASTILADRERNVRLTVMPPFDPRDNDPVVTRRAVQQVLQVLHESFHALHSQLHPARAPGPEFQAMLASHRTPLVTAVVVVVSEPISAREHDIISAIAAHAPVITLPNHRRRHHPQQSQTRAVSQSSSQNGLSSSQNMAPPPLSRHNTQRPTASIPQSPHMLSGQYPHADRGRQPGIVPLRGSRQTVSVHASPPFAYSMPVSATASPPFPPPPDREYVLHLNSMGELAYVLFHSPRALASLRDAAAARFVAWRERERDLSEQSRDRSRQPRVTGLLGFEDVDAGQSEHEDEDQQEDMVMRTMWKLGGYGAEETGTLRPHQPVALSSQSREPLPLFNAPSSVAETASSARQASNSPSPVPVRRRRAELTYGEGSGTPLARSVYHDPLHLPSLLALAVSVLPRTIGAVFSNRTRTRGGFNAKGDDDEDGGWSGLGVLLGVGAACAATFCAGWVCGFWMS